MKRPILMAVPDSATNEADPAAIRRAAYARLVATYDEVLRTAGLADEDRASLLRQRLHAAACAELPPLALARAR
jgi:hypothetical protein